MALEDELLAVFVGWRRRVDDLAVWSGGEDRLHDLLRMAIRPRAEHARHGLPTLGQRETIVNMATGFDRRHPRGVIFIRVVVMAWLLALTGILLANGYWGWALVTLAGAAANIVWAYRVYRATMR